MRMLCTSCWRTARPDIQIGGSDRVELLAWVCFFLPGLLYCAWRHVNRTRVCAACGSSALVREARAAHRREPAVLSWGGGRLLAAAGPLGWPPTLRTPTARIAHGGFGALACSLLCVERALAGGGWLASPWIPALALVVWLAWQGVCLRNLRARRELLQAFDESGRPLHVEALL